MEGLVDINFVWIFLGTEKESNNSVKRFSLIEYNNENLSVNSFSYFKSQTSELNDFTEDKKNELYEIMKTTKFLCNVERNKFGYTKIDDNMNYDIVLFSDSENDLIKNKLSDLLFEECLVRI
jgi:hypothetical protein